MKKKPKATPKKKAPKAKPGREKVSSKKAAPYFGALKKMKYADWHKSWLKGLQVHANSNSGANNYYIQDILLT